MVLGLFSLFPSGEAEAQCTPVMAPFNESFDGLALTSPYTDLPTCWEPQTLADDWDVTNDIVNTGHAWLPNIGDHTTGTGNYMWIDASSDILANEMVTPQIDMSMLTTPYIGFWFASNNVTNTVNHTISLDAWDGAAWVNVTSLAGNFTGWVEVAGTLPAGVPTTTKFRIQAIAATGTTSSTYYYNDLGVDDFFVVEAPTCVKTTNELSSNVTSVSADLAWNHISATSFEVSWGVQGFTPGSGVNSSIVATNSLSISSLAPSTSHDWYVRAICAPGDTSDWSNASNFKTLCPASFTAPYFNGFEFDVLDFAPECWAFYNTTSGFVEVEDFTGTSAPFTGSQALYLYNGSSGTLGADTLLAISPNFSDLTLGDKRIRFQANADNVTTRLIIGTIAAPIPSATFNPIDTVTFLADDTYQQVITNFDASSAYNGTDQYIVFAHELDGGTFKYIRIDDFNYENIPSCIAPTNVMSNAASATTANLTWNQSGTPISWEVEYGAPGFALGSGISSIENAATSSLTALTPNTSYDVYVRTICAIGDTSVWSVVSSFTTPCSAFTAPYYNGFENDALDLDPNCWGSYLTVSNGFVEVENYTGTAAPYAGSQALYLYSGSGFTVGGDTISSVSPNFSDLPAGDKRIRFQANADNVTTRLIVGTMASPNPTATFNPIETITFLADDTYQQVIVNFDAANGYNGTDEYIVFVHELNGGTFKYIRIDDFNYEEIPSCIAPTNVLASNILPTTADVSWTENGTATSWEVEYGAPGFTLGSGTSSVESSTTASLTSLSDATDYDVYVRAICAVGDSSAWSLVSSFSTPCLPIVAPYLENFDALSLTSPYTALPTCWEPQTLADDWDVTNGSTNSPGYLVNFDDHTTGSGNFMWIDASSDILANEMVSPLIDMSGLTNPLVGFWFGSNNVTNAINHTISLDAWDGSAWVNITSEVGNFPSWVEVSGTLPVGIPTTTKFRIQAIAAVGSTTANYYQNDLGVDDFFVIETPSCLSTNGEVASNITAGSADLTWSHPTVSSFEVTWGVSGFTPGSNSNSIIASSNSANLSMLNSNTTYDFYVRAICGVGDTSVWSNTSSFTTSFLTCSPTVAVTLPFIEDWESANGTVNGPFNIVCDPDHTWHLISSDATGRARYGTDAQATSTGNGAITLDRDPSGTVTVNDLILTMDMSAYITDTDLELSFDYAHHGEESHNNDSLWIRGDNNSPWVGVYDLFANKGVINVFNSVGPIDIDAALAAAGQTVSTSFQVRFGQEDDFPAPSDGFTFDNISIISNPTLPCVDPTTLNASNFTANSADLDWTENGTATAWSIEYGPVGFTPGSGTVIPVTSNPHTLSGLNPCSDYDYYVQSDCGAGSLSAQVGPFAFSTLSVTLTGTDVQSACGSYTWIDGMTYTSSNNTATFTVVGAGAFGCDSLLTLDLTVNNDVTGTDTQVACETYTWIDGMTYTSSNNSAMFTIAGGAATGCDSIVTLDLTINNVATGTDVQSACGSYTWIDGNVYTANNNTATYTIVGGAASGCDSIVTLDLMLDIVDVTTTQNGADLSANAVGAMYQWIDCDNNDMPITGENSQNFTATVNGNYAVIVSENGCTDTSACMLVDNVSLEVNDKILGISLYPNPTNGAVTILFENMESNKYDLEVIDATGRKLAEQSITDNSTLVNLSSYDNGVYIIRISNGNSESIHRVIKR